MIFSHKNRSLCSVVVLLAALFLSACENPDQQAAEVKLPEKVVPVSVETVSLADMTEHFTLPANLEAWEDLVIAAENAGPVKKIHFSEGQSVSAGDILLEIDPDTIQGHLAREEENYAVTQRKLNRFRELNQEGLASDQDVDELQNALKTAEINLKNTRLQLEKSFPTAPISGIVDQHYIDRGEYVDPGKPLIRLVQIDKLKAIADLPEKDVPYIQVGQKVEIIPAIINERMAETLTGTIEHIAYSADPATRTYRTKIVIDNRGGQLRPGMIVRARFVRQEMKSIVTAPLYSVLDRDGGKIVFINDNGIAAKRQVQTGSSVDQRIAILQGLNPGQRLIVKGQQLLIDGAKIKVEEN